MRLTNEPSESLIVKLAVGKEQIFVDGVEPHDRLPGGGVL
jgi:hypothetical protein